MINRTNTKQKRCGAVAVEFALVLPLLLLCLFAFYEISFASMIKHTTQSAAYEGARAGIIPGATQQEIEDQVAFVLNSIGVTEFTVNVEQNLIIDSVSKVRVTVNVPFSSTVTGGLLFGDDTSFTGQTALSQETL